MVQVTLRENNLLLVCFIIRNKNDKTFESEYSWSNFSKNIKRSYKIQLKENCCHK